MSIDLSTIVYQFQKSSGRLQIHEHHTDHLGIIHENWYECDANYDINQALIDNANAIQQRLVSDEKENVKALVESGVDHAQITVNHLTSLQKAKQIIKALMFGSPQKMLKAAEYVQGFTNAQIENFFTQAQRIRIRTRQNYILNNQSVFDDDIREDL